MTTESLAPASPPVRTSPARLSGHLDGTPHRALWLVKWLLLVPHLLVLTPLWLGFTVLTLVAGIAVLVTGRYPRSIFDVNVGIMRWTWRVWFYGYGALGTDRYPPFSLDEEPDYPAGLSIAYPERLSRQLVLVKWLLALPHLVVVGVFTGGLGWTVGWFHLGLGLISALALAAGVLLLVNADYPRGLFDLLLGLNRWVLRVAVFVSFMTDEYPPFALDPGETEGGVPA